MPSKRKTVKDRLLESVKKIDTGCWEWTKSLRAGTGYGQINVEGYPDYAHRVSYREFVGPIPEGMQILHRCDNRKCINPEHLFLGTQKDNIKDMMRKKRDAFIGDRNPRALLSEKDIAIIKKRRANGEFLRVIAEDYGVHRQTISDACTGRRWGHLQEEK